MSIDTAELAQTFFQLSNAVDEFRLHNWHALSDEQRQRLKEQAQALETRAQDLTADALCSILQEIQPHLQNIKKATGSAQDSLTRLKDVVKVMSIVDATVALVASIASCDVAAVGADVQNLFQTIDA
jgi:hypothetical protein